MIGAWLVILSFVKVDVYWGLCFDCHSWEVVSLSICDNPSVYFSPVPLMELLNPWGVKEDQTFDL